MKPVIVKEDTFDQEVLNAELPVLVDFWAEWCGPCRAVAPVVDAIAENYDGKLKVGKINVDENPGIPGQYSIRSIPTLLLFKNGQLAATQVGSVSETQLKQFIDNNL